MLTSRYVGDENTKTALMQCGISTPARNAIADALKAGQGKRMCSGGEGHRYSQYSDKASYDQYRDT